MSGPEVAEASEPTLKSCISLAEEVNTQTKQLQENITELISLLEGKDQTAEVNEKPGRDCSSRLVDRLHWVLNDIYGRQRDLERWIVNVRRHVE